MPAVDDSMDMKNRGHNIQQLKLLTSYENGSNYLAEQQIRAIQLGYLHQMNVSLPYVLELFINEFGSNEMALDYLVHQVNAKINVKYVDFLKHNIWQRYRNGIHHRKIF
jgi:hypothetical protein